MRDGFDDGDDNDSGDDDNDDGNELIELHVAFVQMMMMMIGHELTGIQETSNFDIQISTDTWRAGEEEIEMYERWINYWPCHE